MDDGEGPGAGELGNDDDDVGDPAIPDEDVPSELDDPTMLVDPVDVESARPADAEVMDATDDGSTTGRGANGMVAILEVKFVVLLNVFLDLVLPNVAAPDLNGDTAEDAAHGTAACAVGVASGGAGGVCVCAANAAEAHARPTQLNKAVFICGLLFGWFSSLFRRDRCKHAASVTCRRRGLFKKSKTWIDTLTFDLSPRYPPSVEG